jgi:hypothetical protein
MSNVRSREALTQERLKQILSYEAYCAAAVSHFGEFARLDVTRT